MNFRRTTTNTAPHTEPPEKNQFWQKNQLPCPNFNCFFLLMHSLHTTFAPNTARCTFANSRVGTNSGLEENEQMINSAEWRLRRRPKAQHSGAQETWCTVLLHFEQLWCSVLVHIGEHGCSVLCTFNNTDAWCSTARALVQLMVEILHKSRESRKTLENIREHQSTGVLQVKAELL